MADDIPPPPPKKKTGLGKTLLLVLGFVLASGAAGLGAAIGVLKFGGPLLGAATSHAGQAPAAKPAEPVEYVEIDSPFTTNLVDTGRYLQLRLSVSTISGKDVVDAIALHKPALVSAILAVLGDLGEADLASSETKDALRFKLKDVINKTLRARGVTGSIDEVFFVSLVIQ